MHMKKLLLSFIIAITCLLLTVTSIQAMTIQMTPLTQTEIRLTQQTIQTKQTPLINKGKIESGLSRQFNLSPMATILPPSAVQWGSAFGNGDYLLAYDFAKANDGGYLIGGCDSSSMHLIKINSNGGIDWYQIYSSENYRFSVEAVQYTSDNGYIVTGTAGNGAVFLFKIDSLGYQTWMQTYSFAGSTSFGSSDVKELAGGGYVITGNVSVNGVDSVVLMRTDSYGNQLWSGTFRNNNNINGEYGRKVLIDRMNGSIVVFSMGFNHSTGIISHNFNKFNLNGAYLLGESYSDESTATYPYHFIQTQDNGFALVGSKTTYPSGGGSAQSNFSLVKMSNSFGITWVKNYLAEGASYTSGAYVQEIPNSGFIIVGQYGYYTGTTLLRGISLVKVTSSGVLEWIQNNWAFSNYDIPWYVDYTSDGGFVIGGDTNRDQGSECQILIVKLK